MRTFTLTRLLPLLALCWFGFPAYAAEKITYYHLDALGSPVAATNELGNVVWKETYAPYGSQIQKPPAAAGNDRWYTGKPYDSDVGLSYFGARWYDPSIGRFMGVDPQAYQDGKLHSFNRYTYGNNNPYKYVDPDGRWATFIHEASIQRVLSFLPAGDQVILRTQQATIDSNQANNVQFQHSMCVPGQTAQQAWEAGNNFVRTELQAARDLEDAGNHEQALQRVGNAIHTMQDETSPSHRGFQEWDNNGSYPSKVGHVAREMFDPGVYSDLDSATRRTWDLFRSKHPLPKEVLTRP